MLNHPAGSYVTTVPYAYDFARKFMEIINTPGDPVAGRYGPDQSGVIEEKGSAWCGTLFGCPGRHAGKKPA